MDPDPGSERYDRLPSLPEPPREHPDQIRGLPGAVAERTDGLREHTDPGSERADLAPERTDPGAERNAGVRGRYAPVHRRKHLIFERNALEHDTYGACSERKNPSPERPALRQVLYASGRRRRAVSFAFAEPRLAPLKLASRRDTVTDSEYIGPCLIKTGGPRYASALEGSSRRLLGHLHFLHAVTPATPTTTHYFVATVRDFQLEDQRLDAIFRSMEGIGREDVAVLEQIEPALDKGLTAADELHGRVDAGVVLVRRQLEAQIAAESTG